MLRNNSRYYLTKNQAQAYNTSVKVLPEMAETLGDLIQRRMKDVGITSKSELARRIKKSPAYVGDLINDNAKTKSGTYKPSPEVVANLSKHLEVSEIEILNAIGYAPKNEDAETYDVLEGITVSFQHKKLSKAEQEKILDAMRLIARGVIAGSDNKEDKK